MSSVSNACGKHSHSDWVLLLWGALVLTAGFAMGRSSEEKLPWHFIVAHYATPRLACPPSLLFRSLHSYTNLTFHSPPQVIIGSGPAGHTAAIYLARANLAPVMYEGFMANGFAAGGQLTTTTDVENFPGFPTGVLGSELMDKFRAQSLRFGTNIITETVSKIDLSKRPFKYWREYNEGDEPETADTIIIATGASAKRLGLRGEDTYWQSGISACAVCDGAVPIFRNKPLAVIGGGDSAAEEATYLTKYGSHVYLLVRRNELRASKIMAKRVMNNPKIVSYSSLYPSFSDFAVHWMLTDTFEFTDHPLEHRRC